MPKLASRFWPEIWASMGAERPKFKHLADDIGCLKVELNVREALMHHGADLRLILSRRAMIGLERHENIGVLRADAIGLVEGQDEGESWKADIVADAIEFGSGNDLLDGALDTVNDAFGFFDAGAGRAHAHASSSCRRPRWGRNPRLPPAAETAKSR